MALQSPTNKLTQQILNFLFRNGIFAWRNSVGLLPTEHGMYQMGKVGSPDIMGIRPFKLKNGTKVGLFFGCEVKIGKDRLRLSQLGFIRNAVLMGAGVMVVKSFDDFVSQWNKIESSE